MTTPEHAQGISSDVLRDAIGEVQADPELSPVERQLSFATVADRDAFTVYVEIPALVRRLLLHPRFEVESLRVTDAERFGAVVEPEHYAGGTVTGVRGRLPVGCLKVGAACRSDTGKSRIVSDSVLDNDPREES